MTLPRMFGGMHCFFTFSLLQADHQHHKHHDHHHNHHLLSSAMFREFYVNPLIPTSLQSSDCQLTENTVFKEHLWDLIMATKFKQEKAEI